MIGAKDLMLDRVRSDRFRSYSEGLLWLVGSEMRAVCRQPLCLIDHRRCRNAHTSRSTSTTEIEDVAIKSRKYALRRSSVGNPQQCTSRVGNRVDAGSIVATVGCRILSSRWQTRHLKAQHRYLQHRCGRCTKQVPPSPGLKSVDISLLHTSSSLGDGYPLCSGL